MNFIPQGYALISDILKDESEAAIRFLERFEIVVWLSTLSLLLLEAAFIFRPMGREINTRIGELEASEKKAKERAEESKAAAAVKARFLTTMSHEIRTPLSAMIGMTSVLLASRLDKDQREHVRTTKTAGQHLLRVLNDILDLAKLESGKTELNLSRFQLRDEIEKAIEILAEQAEEKGIDLQFSCDGGSRYWFEGDAGRLRQVLLNLVGNAIKFTPQGSVKIIAVASRLESAEVGDTLHFRISVADTGIGIAEQDIPSLFNEFEQIDNEINREAKGTGLGLAICRHLVTAIGGEIGVESQPGRGSTFWFTMPLTLISVKERLSDSAPETPILRHRGLRVLVAEDNPTNRTILKVMLEHLDHETVFAESGAEALELARSDRFDLLLLDVRLPDMDGAETLRRIRNLGDVYASIPAIAVTAHTSEEERRSILDSGFDDHLPKPVDIEKLDRLLRAVMTQTSNPGEDPEADETAGSRLTSIARTAVA